MRCAVVGSPISHSLSPVMHRAAYAELGLDWTYEAREVRGGLAGVVAGLGDDVRGLSVTAPLKREAAALAAIRSQVVEHLGVANTLVRDGDEWSADNTDVPGLLSALSERGVVAPDAVRVLGGGATAASAVHALCTSGTRRVEVLVRDAARAAEVIRVGQASGAEVVVSSLDTAPAEPVDLLVSTIPSDAVEPMVDQWIASSAAVFDVVYDPWPTVLAAAAYAQRLPLASGLDLLAHQAALQVVAMTGEIVGVDVLRLAALAALGQ